MKLSHNFVRSVPEALEQGVLYVSIEYATAIHRCCCGCGKEVVTPLSPRDWKLTFDGETVSLHPSIGNWSFPCRSHYWIKQDRVEWVPAISVKSTSAPSNQEKAKEDHKKAKKKRKSLIGRLFDSEA